MTRSELKARIATRFELLTPEDIESSIAVILEALAASMTKGGRAELRGFGSFWAAYRPPRTGRNPRTGASVLVEAKHAPRFKPTGELRERVGRCEARASDQHSKHGMR